VIPVSPRYQRTSTTPQTNSPEGWQNCLLRSLAVGLAFLRAVDPVEADTFWVLVVQTFNGVAVSLRPVLLIFIAVCEGLPFLT
jgi:hypothetical protein